MLNRLRLVSYTNQIIIHKKLQIVRSRHWINADKTDDITHRRSIFASRYMVSRPLILSLSQMSDHSYTSATREFINASKKGREKKKDERKKNNI